MIIEPNIVIIQNNASIRRLCIVAAPELSYAILYDAYASWRETGRHVLPETGFSHLRTSKLEVLASWWNKNQHNLRIEVRYPGNV